MGRAEGERGAACVGVGHTGWQTAEGQAGWDGCRGRQAEAQADR